MKQYYNLGNFKVNLEDLYKTLKEHKLQNSRVIGDSLSLYCELQHIPDTDIVVFTTTISNNREKTIALPPNKFSALMSKIEYTLLDISKLSEISTNDDLYFVDLRGILSVRWYSLFKCHRIFLIPRQDLFKVIEKVFSIKNIRVYKSLGLKEIELYVEVADYVANILY